MSERLWDWKCQVTNCTATLICMALVAPIMLNYAPCKSEAKQTLPPTSRSLPAFDHNCENTQYYRSWGQECQKKYILKILWGFEELSWSLACDIIRRLCKDCWIPTNSKLLPRLHLSLCFRQRQLVGGRAVELCCFSQTWPFPQLVGSGYSELYLFSRFSVQTFGIWWSFIFYLFTSFVCVLTYVCCSFSSFQLLFLLSSSFTCLVCLCSCLFYTFGGVY